MLSTAEKLMLDEFLAWGTRAARPPRICGWRHHDDDRSHPPACGDNNEPNLRAAAGPAGTGCRPFTNDAKVIAGVSVRYPDVVVTCQSVIGADDIVPEPILVIEVISPSTEREDRGRKRFDYFATPSIQQYAIVEQDERLVDLYTRAGAGWTDEIVEGNATLGLTAIAVGVSLDAIYDETELDPTRERAAAS